MNENNFDFDELAQLDLNSQPKNPSKKSVPIPHKKLTDDEYDNFFNSKIEDIKNIFGKND